MTRYCVTGSNGNIGSVLCRYLLEQGEEVVALTHYNTHNLEEIRDRITVKKGDIRFIDEVVDAVDGCDGVFNLAAQVHVDVSRRYPRLFYETNVGGTFNILEAVRREDIRLVQMSTCEVLGNIETGRADESYPYRHPCSPYASSKLCSEEYVKSYYQTYGIDCNIARGFNLVGPRQRPGSKGAVIPKFVQMVLQDRNPTIYGDGSQVRDYIDVRDLVKGLYALMKSRDYRGELFHFCSGRGVTLKEVTDQIIRSAESSLKPIYVEGRPGELMRSVGDNGKAKRCLAWSPSIPLKTSIQDVLDHLRELDG